MSKDYTRTTITLPKPIFKALKKIVPKGSYSEYISGALRERLAREKSWRFMDAFGKLKVKKGSVIESTEKFLSKIGELEKKEMKKLRKKK